MNAREVWARIPGWPNYEESSHGQVRSVDHVIVDATGRRRHWRGRVLTLHTTGGSGLPRCSLSRGDKRVTYYPRGWAA